MNKFATLMLKVLIGTAISLSAGAYTLEATVDFCFPSSKVLSMCKVDLNPIDNWNYIGGGVPQCYLKKGSSIVDTKEWDDGDTEQPEGVVIDPTATLFPTDTPLPLMQIIVSAYRIQFCIDSHGANKPTTLSRL